MTIPSDPRKSRLHRADQKPAPVVEIAAPLPLAPDAVDRALRAHWPSFDRMRPDHAAKWRKKMEAALRAALTR